MISKFLHGTFICESCNKKTRHHSGSSDIYCRQCDEMMMQENSINDNKSCWNSETLLIAEKEYEVMLKDCLARCQIYKKVKV